VDGERTEEGGGMAISRGLTLKKTNSIKRRIYLPEMHFTVSRTRSRCHKDLGIRPIPISLEYSGDVM
jgi:hypothetical protein